MSYLGRYQEGDFVPLTVQCVNAQGVPTVPDNVPTARIYRPDGQWTGFTNSFFINLQIPPLDRFGTTGLFGYNLNLPVGLAILGNWRVVYAYSIGTYTGVADDTFEVVGGGSTLGNIISAYYYRRPDADYIVVQTDSGLTPLAGEIHAGRNPRI